jgi:hypothetical protein
LKSRPLLSYKGIAMVKLRCLFALGLFCANAVFAQGTVLFTWHGQSNFFQASFEVTAAEMQPGAIWNSDAFSNSITITSLSGATYHNDNPYDYAAGGTYANGTGPYFSTALLNFGTSTEVLVSSALIHERSFSGGDIYFEPGYWTYTAIPERSVASLLALGAVVWRLKA